MDSKEQQQNPSTTFSRRNFLEVTSAALATVGLTGLAAHAQQAQDTRQAEKDQSLSDPGQENKPLLNDNPTFKYAAAHGSQ